MGRRPEPEVVDVDLPRKPIRPDQGYRVGARISAGDTVRARLAGAVAVGIILTGIAFAAIGSLLPPTPELPVAPGPSRSVATALPDVTILNPPAPTRLLPVYAGGLRWLDPANGSLSGNPYSAPRSGIFVDAEGRGLCVCLEIPWSQDRLITRVTLRRYSAEGEEVARATLFELESGERGILGDPIQVDAAISADGRRLWIAHAVRTARAWEIGIARVDPASMTVEASLALDPVPLPAPDDPGLLGPSAAGWITQRDSVVRVALRVSPDGTRLSVLVSVGSRPDLDPELPAYQQARIVVASGLEPGTVPEVAVPARDATEDTCDAGLSGWATNRHFVTICSRSEGGGVQPFVRIENPDDLTRDVAVGPPVSAQDSEWLLDAERGVVYRWSRLAHVFSRLPVATRGMATLAIDWAQAGTGDLGTWPTPVPGEPPWVALAGADLLLRPARMVGSSDGTVIYALGFRSAADDLADDRTASTGIWVFDAGRAQLVAHWAPTALYDQIGFTPGWEQLVTLASPGTDGAGRPADWAASLRFHDVRSGAVTELLGDAEAVRGFVPFILTPNAPRGIAGF